jgi:hypothetical protein
MCPHCKSITGRNINVETLEQQEIVDYIRESPVPSGAYYFGDLLDYSS